MVMLDRLLPLPHEITRSSNKLFPIRVVFVLWFVAPLASCFLPTNHHHHPIDVVHWVLQSSVTEQAQTETKTVLSTQEFPYRVCVSSQNDENSWIDLAAQYLQHNGVCVLYSDSGRPLIQHCDDANEAATSRLAILKERITKGNVNADQEIFRFSEVVSRDVAGGRFDMPIPWNAAEQTTTRTHGIPTEPSQTHAFSQLHSSVQDMVQPIINHLWSSQEDCSSHVAASGFLINQPGSTDQTWHRDGPEAGLINVFIPLVDLTLDIGPTEVWSNTHKDEKEMKSSVTRTAGRQEKMVPLLKKGSLLLMDYRTFHRGLGNYCANGKSRTVAYAVWHRGASTSLADKLSYGLLPRAYPSIEEALSDFSSRQDEDKPFRVKVSSPSINNGKEWIQQASCLLQQTGVCVLDDTENNNIRPKLSENVNKVVRERLEDLRRRILNRGVDPCSEPFSFLELVCKRNYCYELPVSWKNQQDLGTPLSAEASETISEFHAWMESLVDPVLKRVWVGDDESIQVVQSGFVVNRPGSQQYQWSRECSDQGYIQAFSPLDDLTTIEQGPTEVWTKSHIPGDHTHSTKMLPLLKRGQILLMDRRILYQYLANTSSKEWTMAHATWQKGRGEGPSIPDALTLEYD